MNKIIVLATLTMAAMASQAQDLGRVLSATPITQQVAVPQQVCGNETITTGRARRPAVAQCWAPLPVAPRAMPLAAAAAAPQPRPWA